LDYINGAITVTATRCSISVPQGNDGILIKNLGPATVYVGGQAMTADQASTGGFPLSGGETVTIPTIGNSAHDLYFLTATGTAVVAYVAPNTL
jgi:hypothetical protein